MGFLRMIVRFWILLIRGCEVVSLLHPWGWVLGLSPTARCGTSGGRLVLGRLGIAWWRATFGG